MGSRGQHLDTEHSEGRKNCRACTDFKSWMKQSSKAPPTPSTSTSTAPKPSSEPDDHLCPLDKDELGRSGWGLLHSMAAYYPRHPDERRQKETASFLTTFARLYPCDFCAKDMRRDLKEEPPQTESREALSQWMCRLHNKVNTKLGKPTFDCSKVQGYWNATFGEMREEVIKELLEAEQRDAKKRLAQHLLYRLDPYSDIINLTPFV